MRERTFVCEGPRRSTFTDANTEIARTQLKESLIKKQKHEDVIKLADLIPPTLKKMDMDSKKLDFEIMQMWDKFADETLNEKISSNSSAHRINRDRTLIVGVKSAVLANELQFLKRRLEERFKALLDGAPQEFKPISKIAFELRS